MNQINVLKRAVEFATLKSGLSNFLVNADLHKVTLSRMQDNGRAGYTYLSLEDSEIKEATLRFVKEVRDICQERVAEAAERVLDDASASTSIVAALELKDNAALPKDGDF